MLARLVLVALVPLLGACGSSRAGGGGEPTVVASFYPLAYVAERIAGDRAEVVNLTPPGAEAHDIELTSAQVIDISEADLVLYLGGGFQPAVEEVVGDAAIDVSEGLQTLPATDEEEASFDPHIWLDPTRLVRISELVSESLADADPANADAYRASSDDLIDDLDQLDREFEEGLADCASRDFVTSHEAFGYLAARYDLEQIGIAGLDPEAEPSPQRIAEVTDFVGRHDITTIFFETLVSPEVAETIASETGATTAELDPLEGPPNEGDFLTAMRANLQALEEALGCR
jgi:zinc transport system substrate-binding protein